MNLILINTADFVASDTAVLTDHRFEHIRTVHKPEIGALLNVGLLNGAIGKGEVLELNDNCATLKISLEKQPPAALPLTLILALPRPKMLKRILQTVSAMGVKELYLINSYRVDKSYWSTPILNQVEEQLKLGLEQAGDTIMPSVHLRKRFKPFVEDELPEIAKNTRSLIAHPYNANRCLEPEAIPTTLAIGPEGGFIEYEVDKLNQCGFKSIHIGERILRVENAVPVLLAKLFPV
ncbi:16S rRNA (uracil(1498)-N(3))-methyltransferase [Neptuniibacter sp. QD48_11]|uniref:16S rRNA (uracil(1498)-N(3))-methyltransferase n=1 Tax=Neptuniibacter sp. QD48_11 TaxID=3398211 RepID=UPI0039F474D4